MPDAAPVVVLPPSPKPAQPAAPVAPTSPAPAGASGAAPVGTPPAQPAGQPDPKLLQEQFGKLVHREKALLAERQKLTQQRAEFDAAQTARKTQDEETARFRAWKDGAKKDPDSLLKGVYGDNWYETLTDLRLNGKPTADLQVAELRDELEKTKAQIAKDREDAEKAARESAREAEQQAETEFIDKAHSWIKGAGEKYELINLLGSHAEVTSLIKTHWNDQIKAEVAEPKLLSVEEASQMVEDWLEQQVSKAASSKKLTNKKAPATELPKTPEGSPREARTIADLNGSSAPPAAARTEEERTKRAYAAYDASVAARRKQ